VTVISNKIGVELIEALGLPPRTIDFRLVVRVNRPVEVVLRFYPDAENVDRALAVLRGYEVKARTDG
jgi:hypothetical protein